MPINAGTYAAELLGISMYLILRFAMLILIIRVCSQLNPVFIGLFLTARYDGR